MTRTPFRDRAAGAATDADQEDAEVGAPKWAQPPGRGVWLSMPALALMLALMVLPWALAALGVFGRPPDRAPNSSDAASKAPRRGADGLEVRTGPWGELSLIRMVILPSDELLPSGWSESRAPEWLFPNQSMSSLAEWLRRLPLPPSQRSELLDMSRWTETDHGILVRPSDELVFGLSPSHRLVVAQALASTELNPSYASPWSVRIDEFDRACRTAGISAESRRIIEQVAYRRGRRIFVSDLFAVLNRIESRDEKLRVVRMTSSSSAYLARLRIRPESDIGDLIAYWGGRGRRKDLRPIMESIRALPEGGHLDLNHLLPAFARQRLLIYPHPAQSLDGVCRDCHWTSLNFFGLTPENQFGEPAYAQRYILDHYYQISETPQFGDLVFLSNPDGTVIHSCVYIAGDVVFMKNGDSVRQPWTLMNLDDVKELYAVLSASGLSVQFWRNREFEN